jgi:hypothetical protein
MRRYILGFAAAGMARIAAFNLVATDFIREAVDLIITGLIAAVSLIDPRPFLALFSAPRLELETPGVDQVDGSLWTRNRHEAGLARLGSVRHI